MKLYIASHTKIRSTSLRHLSLTKSFYNFSGRYDTDLLKLRWLPGGSITLNDTAEDLRLSESLPSLDVNIQYDIDGECMLTDIMNRKFSCLRFYITFYR